MLGAISARVRGIFPPVRESRVSRVPPHAACATFRLSHLHNFLLAAFQTHEPRYATYPNSLNCSRRAIISDSPHAARATSMPR